MFLKPVVRYAECGESLEYFDHFHGTWTMYLGLEAKAEFSVYLFNPVGIHRHPNRFDQHLKNGHETDGTSFTGLLKHMLTLSLSSGFEFHSGHAAQEVRTEGCVRLLHTRCQNLPSIIKLPLLCPQAGHG